MSKFNKTLKSKYYWAAKGQGKIYRMLKDQIKERGDSAKLAERIGSTPGYVSQILSGDSEINPTWKKIVKFCLALGKVPVLELKDLDTYILEENLKSTYSEYGHLFQKACIEYQSEEVKALEESYSIEIDECTFLHPNWKVKRKESEPVFNEQFDKYELI